jgi:hypothetical protein
MEEEYGWVADPRPLDSRTSTFKLVTRKHINALQLHSNDI